MIRILILALCAATFATAQAETIKEIVVGAREKNALARCRSLSRGLQDMRYTRGKILKPGDFGDPRVNARIARCAIVAEKAEPYGSAVVWGAISLAFRESCFDAERHGKPIEGKAGELGMMQVMVKTCLRFDDLSEDGVCQDPIEAGVRHLANKLTEAKAARCKAHKGKKARCRKKYLPDDLALALSYYNGTRGGITNYGREVAIWARNAAKRYRRGLDR